MTDEQCKAIMVGILTAPVFADLQQPGQYVPVPGLRQEAITRAKEWVERSFGGLPVPR
jgi:hypothetical protein